MVSALTALLCLSGCGPLQKGEYWKGSYAHLDHPRCRFDVPEGWREVKAADFAVLGFNRRAFAGLDDAARKTFFEQAELQIQGLDTGLISERGAWIQISSQAGTGGWYSTGADNPSSRDPVRFALTDSQKKSLWERFAAQRVYSAPPSDKPKLTLEVIDVVSYGLNRALRMRFTSDEARGSLSLDGARLVHEGRHRVTRAPRHPREPRRGHRRLRDDRDHATLRLTSAT